MAASSSGSLGACNAAVKQAVGLLGKVRKFTEDARFETTERHEVNTQLGLVETAWAELVKLGCCVEHLDEYVELKNALKKKAPPSGDQQDVARTVVRVQHDKNLPKFSGQYADWQDFTDSFRIAVGDRTDLTDPQKFLHLQSCVGPKAKALIEKFPLHSEDGYKNAWERLDKEYSNSFEAFKDHIGRVFVKTEIKKGDCEKVREIIGKMEAGVEKMNALVDKEKLLSHTAATHLLSLMDAETREQWSHIRLGGDTIPVLDDVTRFYLMKVKSWEEPNKDQPQKTTWPKFHKEVSVKNEPQEGTSKNWNNRKRFTSEPAERKSGLRSSKRMKIECYRCKGDHPLLLCEGFVKEKKENRDKFANENNLCRTCYGKHNTQGCGVECFKCRGNHIFALCPEREA